MNESSWEAEALDDPGDQEEVLEKDQEEEQEIEYEMEQDKVQEGEEEIEAQDEVMEAENETPEDEVEKELDGEAEPRGEEINAGDEAKSGDKNKILVEEDQLDEAQIEAAGIEQTNTRVENAEEQENEDENGEKEKDEVKEFDGDNDNGEQVEGSKKEEAEVKILEIEDDDGLEIKDKPKQNQAENEQGEKGKIINGTVEGTDEGATTNELADKPKTSANNDDDDNGIDDKPAQISVLLKQDDKLEVKRKDSDDDSDNSDENIALADLYDEINPTLVDPVDKMKKNTKYSRCWRYFKYYDTNKHPNKENLVRCTLCTKDISMKSGSASNLYFHLYYHHKEKCLELYGGSGPTIGHKKSRIEDFENAEKTDKGIRYGGEKFANLEEATAVAVARTKVINDDSYLGVGVSYSQLRKAAAEAVAKAKEAAAAGGGFNNIFNNGIDVSPWGPSKESSGILYNPPNESGKAAVHEKYWMELWDHTRAQLNKLRKEYREENNGDVRGNLERDMLKLKKRKAHFEDLLGMNH
mmetsp:Transcript_21865/g.44384  ORF Transcript_21865/g.44384 Transcript_21865/m.44384 type:complete len:525 (-) Transcript_21865:133-1707(-)